MLQTFLQQIKLQPEDIEFQAVMDVIASHYVYTAATFRNGVGDEAVVNKAGTNEGSCKIFAFAQLNHLSEAETLACFGKYYREDVLQHPEGVDHANIRTFMRFGWQGIDFDTEALMRT